MLRVEHGGRCGARLVTTAPYAAGRVIGRLAGSQERRHPTSHSIQVDPGMHLDGLGLFAYLNHSCAPNAVVDTGALTVRAARDIAAGEELTFFYPSTEWEMAEPFACLCGDAGCVGTVAGAKFLPPWLLARYFVNRHIAVLIGRESEAGREPPCGQSSGPDGTPDADA